VPHEIPSFQWADFAALTGTSRSVLAREIRRLGKAALAAAPVQAAEGIYVGEERALVADISGFVQQQANNLLAMASPMTQVGPSVL
jgi:hypothetical protein